MGLEPYFGDPHVHSRRSDGSLRPEEIFRQAADLSLDYVALADHGVQPHPEAPGEVRSLPAIEFSLGHKWHMVALGPRIPSPWPQAGEVPEWSAELHCQGGALILAHPWTISGRPSALQSVERWLAGGFLDGIELLNTSVRPDKQREWLEMLRHYRATWSKYGPAVLGGSDYHHSRHGKQMALGCTYIFAEEPSQPRLIQGIRRRWTVAAVPRGGVFWAEWLQLLNRLIPGAEFGVGPSRLLGRLAKYRRAAAKARSPGATRAAQAGNYRLALEINQREHGR